MCLTLVLDLGKERILLGEKLHGFGKGNLVAPGGKIDPGEAPRAAAVRELREETGLVAESVEDAGELTFTWADPDRQPLLVTLFAITAWSGKLRPSDELDARWMAWGDVPYDRMWDDDRIWLPNVLRGGAVTATIGFGPGGRHVEAVQLATQRRLPCSVHDDFPDSRRWR